ncbi:Os08g0474800, partial [Oryza sativa Japonica Group]
FPLSSCCSGFRPSSSHPDYAIDRASAAFITRRLNAWDWGPMSNGGNRRLVVSNGGNRRLATRIKSSVQQAAVQIKAFVKYSVAGDLNLGS